MNGFFKLYNRVRGIGSAFTLFCIILISSILAGTDSFPFHNITEAADTPQSQDQENDEIPEEFLKTPREYFETDVAALISINQPEDVARVRNKLRLFLFGQQDLPATLPETITRDHADPRYEDIASLERIDRLIVAMDYGLESQVYHFIPENPNHKVVLYHQGHRDDFIQGKEQITALLAEGYAVAAFSMPLLGPNNQPTVQLPRIGRLKLTTHDHMKFLSPETGHPVKYFIEPVVSVVNYLGERYAYTSISMVGISGGGWTTTLAAAVDPRIAKSFPVAGSYPIYLRSNSQRDWGDFEQTVPELYTAVNYPELYILSAYGEHRQQLQIINQFDSCCFAGTKWETYKDVVRTRVRTLGAGEFDLYLDDSHKEHKISQAAMSRILDALD
ncbi:MAG TPA: hypothetical protein VKA68_07175 [bacterium]|nr:hypothetical protein [bacterium]